MPKSYLDYNATSPMRPAVIKAMQPHECCALNPSSTHAAGRVAKKLLEDSRKAIADSVSVFANEVLFTGSATEANNMVLRGFDRPMLVSAIEHASILKTASLLGGDTLPVDENGIVILEVLDKKLAALGRPALVSVMLANNETGVINPIAEIADIVHKHGGLLHTDAVQAIGKIPVDFGLLKADMMTIGAHKVGGPIGIGALILRNDVAIKPLLTGGGQELGRRAGTEDVVKTIGFAALMGEVANCPEAKQHAAWRDWLEAELGSVVFSKDAPRLPNTLQIAMPNVKSETQLMNFDLEGYAVSAGSACSSGRIEPSYVLKAMGITEETASCAIRISMGWNTTENDVKSFASAWKNTYERLGKHKAA
ncbi:MAG: cysteine desulfurase [Alphaproteobacteria bacterium]|nr:cysteine desulfurase [Alphaproteobacteria bacterium]